MTTLLCRDAAARWPARPLLPGRATASLVAGLCCCLASSVPAMAEGGDGGAPKEATVAEAEVAAPERALPSGGPCDFQEEEALMDLLPLRRHCLAERPCALAFAEPASTRPELVSLAEELAARIALTLSRREALCIDDPSGRWSKRAGEPLRRCPHDEARHRVAIRLDPQGRGFLATAFFSEAARAPSPDSDAAAAPRQAPPQSGAPPAFSAAEPARLRLRTELPEERELAFAADRLADALGDALGTEPLSAFDIFLRPPEAPRFHLNLKLGNTLAALDGFDFSAFTLRFDLEFDYYLRPYLLAFLEVGLAIGNAKDKSAGAGASEGGGAATDLASGTDSDSDGDDPAAEPLATSAGKGSFSLVPVKIGLKYNPLHQYSVRPYVGAGIGLGILSDLVEADSREVTLSLSGILGVAWVPFNHLGFNFETSLNFDELRISGGSNVLFGFSINFGVLALF